MLPQRGIFILVLFLCVCQSLQEIIQQCEEAPTKSLKDWCYQIRKWDSEARLALSVTSKNLTSNQIVGAETGMVAFELAKHAADEYQCTTLGCLCKFFKPPGKGDPATNDCTLPDGRKLKKVMRKEMRVMSDAERRRYFAAVQKIQKSGQFHRLRGVHSAFGNSGGAHAGPAFLPWHREFLKRYETAIRLVDPEVAVPYWDSTLDTYLPNPADSIMYSDIFMGTTDADGHLVTGEFAGFTTPNGIVKRLTGLNERFGGGPFNESEVDWFVSQTDPRMIYTTAIDNKDCDMKFVWTVIEMTHGKGHVFQGGDMGNLMTAADDPIFYSHHSMVDHIWQLWRRKQKKEDLENQYPTFNSKCASDWHKGDGEMAPFKPMINKDGLKNFYTDNFYDYAPRPTCDNNCGDSPYLFCAKSVAGYDGKPHCLAKVKPGGLCKGFEDAPICYNGKCEEESGVCIGSIIDYSRLSYKSGDVEESSSEGCTLGFDTEDGVDYLGNDLKPYPGSVDECQSYCKKTPGCAGYTYNKNTKTCWTKSKLIKKRSFGEAISGVLTQKCDKCVKSCNTTEGADYLGNDILFVTGNSPSDCCVACQKTPGCVGWTLAKNANICWLKNAMMRKRDSADAISGFLTDKCGGAEPEKPAIECPTPKINQRIIGTDVDMDKVDAKNIKECCEQCGNKPGCVAYTFSVKDKKCTFKKSAGKLRSTPGEFSGIFNSAFAKGGAGEGPPPPGGEGPPPPGGEGPPPPSK